MIGGEFPIAIIDLLKAPSGSRVNDGTYHYASGRAALYQILKYLKEEKGITSILLPDYLCDTILVPIRKLAIEYTFFPLNEKLELEKDKFKEVYKKNSVVLLINYFGLQDLSEQIAIIRNIDADVIIIEDDVQAYYEFKKPLGNIDFKYTSLRKTFAIPDGGLVKTEHPLSIIDKPNTFGQYKAASSLMKAMREGNFDDSVYLDISKIGGSKIDDELDCSMSLVSERLYACLDEEEVKARRQKNAKYLTEKMSEKGIPTLLPVSEDKVPLFVPILLENRDEVRKQMFQHEIFSPVHWPLVGMKVQKGAEMTAHELSLVVDQRYELKDMDEIIKLLQ